MRSKVKDRLLYQLNDTYDVPYVLCTFAIYLNEKKKMEIKLRMQSCIAGGM